MVPLGTPVPGFKLRGIDDQFHSLGDYSEKKVLVVIFMCNHCPYVQAIWDDLVALEKRSSEDVQFIGINPNGANPNYPEDSFEKMREYAAAKGQSFPYLIDETQEVAKAFGAQCTPDIFLYGLERTLLYRGAFEGLEHAINMTLKGEKPAAEQKYSMGCSLKWSPAKRDGCL